MTTSSSYPLREQTLFEGLNARKLTPKEIAESFVMPEQFRQMVGPDHTFLVGPRGSGKTTLLRMLQGESLMAWTGKQAEEIRAGVGYSAIFVPSDRLWASQVEAKGNLPNGRLAVAAFTTQVLIAFLETVLYRVGEYASGEAILHPAELAPDNESSLVAECARAWKISLRAKTIFALQGALDHRLSLISDELERRGSPSGNEEIPDLSVLVALRLGIRSFNRYARQPTHRWALLLDEMELAPQSIHNALTSSLRGGEQHLVLKLSFSPFDRYVEPATTVGGASVDNDYVAIYLSSGQRGTRKFTNELFARMMRQSNVRGLTATRVLGQSLIDNGGHAWRSHDYGPDSDQDKLLRKVWVEDPSFRAFMERRKISSVDDVQSLTYAQRSATVRKAYPLLVFRNSLCRVVDGVYRRSGDRSKPTDYFSGFDAVVAALEGNPRWIKATFSQMLASFDAARNEIPRGVQYDVLLQAARRFESLLRLLPSESADQGVSVLQLIDLVSSYFSERTLGNFTADPPSVFLVDDAVQEAVLGAVRAAVISGALVHVRGENSPPVLADVKNERFRVAHLMTVRKGHEVPFRLGRSVSLSRILRGPDRRPPDEEEPTLWDVE